MKTRNSFIKPNNPFFADLSTYSPKDTIPFYENVFGWKFYKENDYYTAFINNMPVVGLYETPEKFKQMRMPHFWMTYIQVNNANETVAVAKKLGGIIEMQDEIPYFGTIALIRDPQGAGFTIYEGEVLTNTRTRCTNNTLIWNELHVSEMDKVISFYEGIFNWNFESNRYGSVQVVNHNSEHIADIQEIPNILKGKYEYWVSCFGVHDLSSTKAKIVENGGKEVLNEGNRILFMDNSEQAFFYIVQT